MAVSQLRLMTSKIGFNHLFQRIATKPLRHSFKTIPEGVPEDKDDDMSQPIKYSTSPAAQWAARHSFSGVQDDDTPWFQSHIVAFSTMIFLVYFLYVREANDIDQIFDRELGDYFDVANNDELKRKMGQNKAFPPGRA